MYIYITLICVCLFNGYLMDKIQNRDNNKFKHIMFFTFIMLFLISALRYQVGQDYTDTYVRSYNLIVSGQRNVRMDIGVKTIYKIMAFLHANVQWIFVITSFIINLFACKSIENQSPNCKMSFWIYVCGTMYFFSMNGVRQAVAMMLFYYSFRFIRERNLKMYFIINGIGFLFHSSAIIFFPLYFVLNKKYKFKLKMIVIGGTLLASRFVIPVLNSILMKTHYSMYLTNDAYTVQKSLNFSMYLNIALFLIYEWIIQRNNIMKDEQGEIYANMHFCGVIVSLLTTSIPLMIRIFMSFRYIEFLSVPYLVEMQTKNKYRQIIIFAIMVCYFMYFVWGVLIQNGNTVLPYKTIFSKAW